VEHVKEHSHAQAAHGTYKHIKVTISGMFTFAKTTQRSYIKTVPRVVTQAMKQLEEKIARAAVVQQVSVN
jgi:hypothetical protein